jgi:hypothetical protein
MMKRASKGRAAAIGTLVLVAACSPKVNGVGNGESGGTGGMADVALSHAPPIDPTASASDLEQRLAQFAPAEIGIDSRGLQPWERGVLDKLIEASSIINDVFLLQVSPYNPAWHASLASRSSEQAHAATQYFELMAGPWDRLRNDEPFASVGAKPAGAGFYPPDMTKTEFDAWVAAHPSQKDAFTGYFTVIRRTRDGLAAVPYSRAYAPQLQRAAALLREAADLSENASLKDYLNKRAEAFLTDDYYASDVAWMDITGTRIEPTIGPYEVYEDALFGYKAYFESYITVADPAASAELHRLKDYLQRLEASLPIEDRYKSPDRKFESPIRVVDEVYTAGGSGVQTTAFNLPNDVRVIEQKGSKKVMLRNVAHAKFDKILVPIAREMYDARFASSIAFQPWFTNVVMHELAHGLGPTTVTTPSGERMSVNKALREQYSALEEAKADVTGLHNLTVLAQQGVYDQSFVAQAFSGHAVDLFRAVRFGTSDAHGRANLIQYVYYRRKNALQYDAQTGKFTASVPALIEANRALASEILTIQATGDYARATAFVQRYTQDPTGGAGTGPGDHAVRELNQALARMTGVPVDIRPVYTTVRH